MWSKKIAVISVISTAALLASVGIASAMPNFSQGQLSSKSIAFGFMNKSGRAGFGGSMGSVMSVVAKDLNVTTQTLMSDLSSGKSINDLATAQGVDASKIATDVQTAMKANIDKAVQSGKMTSDQATTMESNLPQRVQTILSQTRQAKANKKGAGFAGPMGSVMSVVAKDLNMTTQTIMTDLSSGKSINDLATAQGVDVNTLATDVKNALKENIDKAVQSGKMTSDQATTMESNLDKRVQAMLSQTLHSRTRKNSSSQNATTSNANNVM